MTTSQWLRSVREEAGISAEEATFRLRSILPKPMWVSSDTVRRTENSPKPDPVLAAALARACDHPLTDAPEELREQLDALRNLLGLATPEEGLRSYPCNYAPVSVLADRRVPDLKIAV